MKRGLMLLCLLSLAGCGGGSSSISPPPPGGNSGGLAASFFGMTIGDAASYPPSNVPIGAIGHPTRLAWGNIEVSKGSFQWSFYDTFVGRAFNHGVPFMMTFGSTPSWALADQSSCTGPICTAPPDNIQDWIDFVTAVVNHYNGVQAPHIKYYELWDEANQSTFWTGTQAQLVSLAQAAYPIIHQDAASLLLTPSVTGNLSVANTWMQGYLQAGGNKYADGGTFHGYLSPNGTSPYPFPEDNTSSYGDIVTRANTFRATFDANGLAGKPMFDSEGSWGQSNITDPDQQAAWLARWYILQAGAGVSAAYWFSWGDSNLGGTSGQQWGAIANPDGTPNQAGIAYGQVYDWLVGATISPCARAADDTWTCALSRSGGYQGQIVWNHSTTQSYQAPAQFKRSRDLAGNVATISGAVSIGSKPILSETGAP